MAAVGDLVQFMNLGDWSGFYGNLADFLTTFGERGYVCSYRPELGSRAGPRRRASLRPRLSLHARMGAAGRRARAARLLASGRANEGTRRRPPAASIYRLNRYVGLLMP